MFWKLPGDAYRVYGAVAKLIYRYIEAILTASVVWSDMCYDRGKLKVKRMQMGAALGTVVTTPSATYRYSLTSYESCTIPQPESQRGDFQLEDDNVFSGSDTECPPSPPTTA